METTLLSDDQSCESTSAFSDPSLSISWNRSGDKSRNKNKALTPRRGKRGGGGGGGGKQARTINQSNSGKQKGSTRNSKTPQVSSRWDALKPEVELGNVSGGKTNNQNHVQQPQQGRGDLNGGQKARVHQQAKSPGKKSTPRSSRRGGTGKNSAVSANGKPFTPGVNKASTPVRSVPSPPPGFDNNKAAPAPALCPVHSWEGMSSPGFASNDRPSKKDDQDVLTALLQAPPATSGSRSWDVAAGKEFVPQACNNYVPFGGIETTKVKENPFDNTDSQIEAELQELGGQMAGSILDF